MKKVLCVTIALLILTVMLVGCTNTSNKKAEKYIGVWYAYKVATNNNVIVFKDYASIAKMELTCEFTADGKYTVHYYVNGKEGDKYPQNGTYTIKDDKIVLTEDGGVGEIINGELILSFSEGGVKQYFRSYKWLE